MHVSRLLAAGNQVQNYDPQSPASATKIYEGFLFDTHAAITEYGDVLVAEILRVVTKICATLKVKEKNQIIDVCAGFLGHELYLKRRGVFEDGLERKIKSYGQILDTDAHRFDVFRSRYEVVSKNLTRRTQACLRDELDLLVLANVEHPENEKSLLFRDAVSFKPGLFGFSLDFKHLMRCWKKRKNEI